MKILLTGGSGYVGSHLLPELLRCGYQILQVVRHPTETKHKLCSTLQVDLKHDEFVSIIREFSPRVCIHLAAHLSPADDYQTAQKLLESNILFTTKMLDALKNTTLKFFINTGTFAEYFEGDDTLDPAYLYAATKTATRSILQYYAGAYGFHCTTVVPYTVYGGNTLQNKIIDIIYQSVGATLPVDLTLGKQVLDFIHIDDIVSFYLVLLRTYESASLESIPLGTGRGHSLRQLAAIVEAETGGTANINWGGRPYRVRDTQYAVANMAPVYDLWSWRPKIDLVTGVKKYIKSKPHVTS